MFRSQVADFKRKPVWLKHRRAGTLSLDLALLVVLNSIHLPFAKYDTSRHLHLIDSSPLSNWKKHLVLQYYYTKGSSSLPSFSITSSYLTDISLEATEAEAVLM